MSQLGDAAGDVNGSYREWVEEGDVAKCVERGEARTVIPSRPCCQCGLEEGGGELPDLVFPKDVF
jgi:hypothetical protein